MNLLPVGEFKAKFSEVLQKVQKGTSFGITYGKGKKKVAVVIPYKKYMNKNKFKLGLLVGKASFKLHNDFKMTDQEFLNSWNILSIRTFSYGQCCLLKEFPKE